MDNSKEKISIQIDQTFETLLENQTALKMIEEDQKFTHEVEALKKMQESLLAKLIALQGDLEPSKNKAIKKSKVEKRKQMALQKASSHSFLKGSFCKTSIQS